MTYREQAEHEVTDENINEIGKRNGLMWEHLSIKPFTTAVALRALELQRDELLEGVRAFHQWHERARAELAKAEAK